jgi:hypothetical protein
MDPERRRILVPRRTWLQRNPRLFVIVFTSTMLLSFFSKPIYDGFIRDDVVAPPPANK